MLLVYARWLDVSKVPFGSLGVLSLGVSKGTFMAWTCGVWLSIACPEGHLRDGERLEGALRGIGCCPPAE
jgi:hypothetical protein